MENVSHEEAEAFCKKLTAKEAKSGRKYRLPTEAEWEYSCRGGAASSTPFHFGDTLSSSQANFDGNYPYGGADKGEYLARRQGGLVQEERIRFVRHARQRVGVVFGLVQQGLLR